MVTLNHNQFCFSKNHDPVQQYGVNRNIWVYLDHFFRASDVSLSLSHSFVSIENLSAEKWNIFCHISKQGCHRHQQLQPPQWWAAESWGNSGRKQHPPSGSHQAATTPYGEPQGSSGFENSFWPQIAEVCIKGMISVSPDSSIFSNIEKH